VIKSGDTSCNHSVCHDKIRKMGVSCKKPSAQLLNIPLQKEKSPNTIAGA
jgi:hypothetical protein